MPARRRSFRHEGFRLVYDEYGAGPRPLVLLPGLLLSRKMHGPLAQALAERGNHVYVLDFLGHGDSDRPRDMARYTMPLLGDQVVALLDHLELEEAVLGGTSLGANVSAALPAAARARRALIGVASASISASAIAPAKKRLALRIVQPDPTLSRAQ